MTHAGDSVPRYLCMSVDIKDYSRNDDAGQAKIQSELNNILDMAGSQCGMHREKWLREPKGDEELALVWAGESERAVVDDYVREIGTVLFRRNCERPTAQRLRVRVAVDYGPADIGPDGFSGQLIVAVSRLIDAEVMREVLNKTNADMVALMSRRVFNDLIGTGRTTLDPTSLRQVTVSIKGFREEAWLRVPGVDVHAIALTQNEPVMASRAPESEPAAVNPHLHGIASTGGAVYQAAHDLNIGNTDHWTGDGSGL